MNEKSNSINIFTLNLMLLSTSLWLSGKESRDVGLILGSWRSPGEGSSNPLQYSCPWTENLTQLSDWTATDVTLSIAAKGTNGDFASKI